MEERLVRLKKKSRGIILSGNPLEDIANAQD
jgi:hypothetical protein